MKSPPRLVALVVAAVVALLAWNRPAAAQSQSSIMINMPLTRSHSQHPTNNGTANDISRADCSAGDVITVPLTVSAPLNFTFQAWVSGGSDCTVLANRTGSAAVCSLVFSTTTLTQPTTTVDLSVQDLLHGLINKGTTAEGQGSATDCDNTTVQTNSQPQPLDIWFMYFFGDNVDSSQMLGLSYALIGPDPPANLQVGGGDGILKLTWTQAAVGTVGGYYFFCHLIASGGATVADAGGFGGSSGTGVDDAAAGSGGEGGSPICDAGDPDADDAGDASCSSSSTEVDSSTSSDAGGICTDSVLVAGTVPSQTLFTNYLCGRSDGSSANAGLVTGLNNGDLYAVSVASFDQLGNTGALSEPHCDSPNPIDDFFTVYRRAGGTAGGSSFCSVSSLGRAGGAAGAGGVLAGLALALLRRRGSRNGNGARKRSGTVNTE